MSGLSVSLHKTGVNNNRKFASHLLFLKWNLLLVMPLLHWQLNRSIPPISPPPIDSKDSDRGGCGSVDIIPDHVIIRKKMRHCCKNHNGNYLCKTVQRKWIGRPRQRRPYSWQSNRFVSQPWPFLSSFLSIFLSFYLSFFLSFSFFLFRFFVFISFFQEYIIESLLISPPPPPRII